MAQNPIRIFVEGNAIALALDPTSKNLHTADLKQSGARLGFVSIDELHDPAQQTALRQRIAGYYRNIPLEPLKIEAVNQQGVPLANKVIQNAGNNAVTLEGLKRIITENAPASPQGINIKRALVDNLQRNGIEPNPEGLTAAIARYASANNKATSSALSDIIRGASIDLRISKYSIFTDDAEQKVRKEMENTIPFSERQALGEKTRRETFDHLMSFIPTESREEAWKKYEDASSASKGSELLELIKSHWVNSDAANKAVLFDKLADTVKKEGISIFMMPSIGRQSIDFKMVEGLGNIQANPSPHVERLLEDMRGAGYQPLKGADRETAEAIRKDFQASVAQMPDFVRDAASVIDIHAVVGKPGTRVDDIIPSKGFLDGLFTQRLGASTGTALYLDAKTAATPAVVAEEMLHEVDRAMGWYSHRPEWKAAVDKDCTPGTPPTGKVAKKLIATLKDRKQDVGKGNTCFDRPSYPIETQIEALPDMMHCERIAGSEIAQKGKFKTGLLSSLPTVDAVMDAAFPNTGKLYRGPAKGSKLAQHPDGTVLEIPASQTVSGAKEVTAFATACRDFAEAGKAKGSGAENVQATNATDMQDSAIHYRTDWAARFGKKPPGEIALA